MNKDFWIRKLTSRKLWMAIVGLVSSVMIARGADEGSTAQVASIIMQGATVISYILSEGLVDASNVPTDDEEE